MNSNTILLRLGIDPSDFINEDNEPIINEDSFVYEVRQRTDIRKCPNCNNKDAIIKDYYYTTINCSETDQRKDFLRIKKVRFKCKKCNTTFTMPISGLTEYGKTSRQTYQMIINDFRKSLSFVQIANRYGISTARVVQIFDEKITYVPRLHFNEALCIDEIKFKDESGSKYCCVLYDFNSRKIIDIIKSRQLPYLDEYFSKIPEAERNKVKYFISDMYDGYKTICRKYFKKAIQIVDLFHVITQLTNAVNKIRVTVMNKQENTTYKNFMKSHWKLFLCRKDDIPNKTYTPKNTGVSIPYVDLVYDCVLNDSVLLEAYNCLQDLFKYDEQFTFTESLKYIDYISERLNLSSDDNLKTVGRTYHKWRVEIANGLAKTQNEIHYTNAIAESLNNQLKTIIKVAYGYKNFERFRKRALLIIN